MILNQCIICCHYFSGLQIIRKAAGYSVNDENTTDGCMHICRF